MGTEFANSSLWTQKRIFAIVYESFYLRTPRPSTHFLYHIV
jgi:hypothetical protein